LDQFGAEAQPAIPALKKAVKDDDKFVRCLAMHALGRIGGGLGGETSDVVKLLLEAISDNVIEVRVAAIGTLGKLGTATLEAGLKVVKERLEKTKQDSERAVREAATDALKKLGGTS